MANFGRHITLLTLIVCARSGLTGFGFIFFRVFRFRFCFDVTAGDVSLDEDLPSVVGFLMLPLGDTSVSSDSLCCAKGGTDVDVDGCTGNPHEGLVAN